MRRWLITVGLLITALAAPRCWGQGITLFVAQRPCSLHYVQDGSRWWLEADALLGAMGIHDLHANAVRPDLLHIDYKGHSFDCAARLYAANGPLLVDGEPFVKGLGWEFSYKPSSQRIDIQPAGMAAATPTPTPVVRPPSPTPTPPPVRPTPTPASSPPPAKVVMQVDFFQMQIGPEDPQGRAFRARVSLDNRSGQAVSVVLRIMDGDRVINEQGPTPVPIGMQVCDWNFHSSVPSPNVRVVVLVDNKEVAFRMIDKVPDATPSTNPSGPPGF